MYERLTNVLDGDAYLDEDKAKSNSLSEIGEIPNYKKKAP
jgi:hypothetical protein